MGKLFEEVTPELAEWVARQRMFFVASAPLAGDGLINCSPKGMDTLRIVGPRTVAYLDLTGSGVETIAHVKENGRLVFLFCAFEGPPRIVRFHGKGEVILPGSPEWAALRAQFPDLPGARAILCASLDRISDSCGFGVPHYDFVEERDALTRFAESKGPEGLKTYWGQKNAASLDGLPGLVPGG